MAESTELMTVDNICNRVYIIRGQQVMLDYDLAELYGYEVKALNQQVKRNIDRFPEDFMFQLKKEEVPKEFSKSQIVTLNEKGDKRGTNIKKMPYAFSEQGIYMLATVLKGELAVRQSIALVRTFKKIFGETVNAGFYRAYQERLLFSYIKNIIQSQIIV